MRIRAAAIGIVVACLAVAASTLAHCEIPCGIYDDEMRLKLIEEHTTTIEKSMKMIVELSAEGEKNYNQLVRWIHNKESHADQLQDIVSQYFMTQRVKPVDEKSIPEHERYITQLTLLHQMLVAAMRAKQTTNLQHVAELRSLVGEFRAAYLIPGRSQHSHH